MEDRLTGSSRPGLRYAAFVLSAAVAFVVGLAIALVGTPCGYGEIAEDYRAWALLLGLTFATATWVFVASWQRFVVFRKEPASERTVSATSAVPVVIVIVFVVVVLPMIFGNRPEYPAKLCGVGDRVLLSQIALFPLALAPMFVAELLRQQAGSVNINDPVAAYTRLVNLQSLGDQALLEASAQLTLSLIATSLLRRVTIQMGGTFTDVSVLVFGVQFSALLTVFFWPFRAEINRKAETLVEMVAPRSHEMAVLDSGAVALKADVAELRDRLELVLGARVSVVGHVQRNVAVLFPLLASMLDSVLSR
jgi:hypothetical protein